MEQEKEEDLKERSKSFTFPKLEETQEAEMIEDLLKRLGAENSEFQEEKVREKLARYDQLIKNYQIEKKKLEILDDEEEEEEEEEREEEGVGAAEGEEEERESEPEDEKVDENGGEDETLAEKKWFDPDNIKNPKKRELHDYLMSEKAMCESINQQMEFLEKKLYEVTSENQNNIAVKVFEESKEEINKVLDQFAGLEKEIKTQLNESSSDESDLSWEEELKNIKELRNQLDRNLGQEFKNVEPE